MGRQGGGTVSGAYLEGGQGVGDYGHAEGEGREVEEDLGGGCRVGLVGWDLRFGEDRTGRPCSARGRQYRSRWSKIVGVR